VTIKRKEQEAQESRVDELCKAVVKAKDQESYREATDRLRIYLAVKPEAKRPQHRSA
jgi:hypothetical protein